jgi:hypothetical protein
MSNILYEYRAHHSSRSGKPNLLTDEQFSNIVGFRSIFGFPEEAQANIIATRSTANLGNFELYCDMIYLDFDNDEIAEDSAIKWLQKEAIACEIYHSGNRGKHIHIPIVPLQSKGIPNKVRRFVDTYFKGADLSIYKPSGIFRLAGTPHLKRPGNYKDLIHRLEGKVLDINQYPIISDIRFAVSIAADEMDLSFINTLVLQYSHTNISEGGRNTHLNSLIWACSLAGFGMQECKQAVEYWNLNHCSPSLSELDCDYRIKRMYNGL